MLSVNKQRHKTKTWHNWSESVHCQIENYVEPRSLEELITIVKNCSESGRSIRVVGAGHSFTPLVATSDVLLSIHHLKGIEQIDWKNNLVTVWGGTYLKELGEQLFARDLAMENLGDINVQSIAGAISTGTHGTGITFGNIPTQVVGLTIISASGELLEISEFENAELFQAAKISLGMLGIIVKVQLKVVPAYPLIAHSYRLSLDNCIQQLSPLKEANRNFEFYWFPYTKTVQVKTMNHYYEQNLPRQKQSVFKKVVIENGLFWALSEMSRVIPKSFKTVSTLSAIGVPVGKEINHSHILYATPRLVKFQEMEYSVPEEAMGDVLKDINHMIQKRKFKVHFPIECRYVNEDDIWLSPSYKRKSAYIAVHMYKGMDYQAYFKTMEEIFRHYEGRPHWGKMHSMAYEQLEEVYPKLHDFLSVRKRLDDKRIFSNSYLKDLFRI